MTSKIFGGLSIILNLVALIYCGLLAASPSTVIKLREKMNIKSADDEFTRELPQSLVRIVGLVIAVAAAVLLVNDINRLIH